MVKKRVDDQSDRYYNYNSATLVWDKHGSEHLQFPQQNPSWVVAERAGYMGRDEDTI